MAFSMSELKAATRSLFVGSKAQVADNGSLSHHRTKDSSGIFTKLNLKIKGQCRKTAAVLHRRCRVEPSTVADTSEYTIPPIKFSQADLPAIASDILESPPRSMLGESTRAHSDNERERSVPVTEPSVTTVLANRSFESGSSAAVSTQEFQGQNISSMYSTSTLSTALTIDSATASLLCADRLSAIPEPEAVTKRKPAQISQAGKAQSVSSTRFKMSNEATAVTAKAADEKATSRKKIVAALQKLKAQLWPRKVPVAAVAYVEQNEAEAEKEEEHCIDRCQWDVITKIQPATIIEILRTSLSAKYHKSYREAPMKVVRTAQGAYHLVFIVKTFCPVSHELEGWVVKIPGHGTKDRWTADDEYMLTQEVETMCLITTYTAVPAPIVFDHSATLDNKFGFPYIVMKELPGKTACELWYENHAEIPSPETEQKRLNCLRSLARHMTELNQLRFDQIGMPVFNPFAEDFENCDDIEEERLPVGKYYVWPYYDTYRSVERGPFTSTQDYVHNAIENLDGLDHDEPKQVPSSIENDTLSDVIQDKVGTAKLLSIILSHPVFQSTLTTTFALRHSDLDLQNILIDDSGHVIGILDWDASLAMPRCVAHSSVPGFLDIDYYRDPIINSPFLCWRVSHYRDIYAAAMVEAGNPDAQYTSKSHIYQAVLHALYTGGDTQEQLLARLLTEIRLQISLWEVKFLLTKGCKATEKMLKEEMWKALDPEMPDEDLLQRVEQQIADAAVQEWMDGFAQVSLCPAVQPSLPTS